MEPKEEIRSRADIVEVIQDYLTLKPAGSGSFKALCPFHGEKTPSFYVSREKQIWHCFGCDMGGDVFSFLMELENMSFVEALRFLGKKYGVEVPEYQQTDQQKDQKEQLREINDLACRFYEKILHEHSDGQLARDYLKERGIDLELARCFRLGFAPERWDLLLGFLKKRGFREKQIIEAGLVKPRRSGSGLIDRFRSRVTIPLGDARGNVVGFTGRLLLPVGASDEHKGPKYLNSPETPIYHKSDILFGLHLARQAIRQAQAVIVVEGNLDVVASHKAGVEQVIASSGTALTESQLSQLKRLTSKIIFAFDADSAGFQAASRGIKLAQSLGFDIAVIAIPPGLGKDPDEVVQKDPQVWRDLVQKPVHIMDYYFDQAMTLFDIKQVEGKRGFAQFIASEIGRLPDLVEREHWLQKLADIINVEIEVLRQVVNRQKQTPSPRVESERVDGVIKKQPAATKTGKADQAAAFLLGLVLHDSNLAPEIIARLDAAILPAEPWARLYKKLVLLYNQHKSSGEAQINLFSIFSQSSSTEPDEDQKLLNSSVLRAERAVANLSGDQVRQEYHRHIEILKAAAHSAQRKQLEAAIRQAEQSGDSERLNALIEKYSKLL